MSEIHKDAHYWKQVAEGWREHSEDVEERLIEARRLAGAWREFAEDMASTDFGRLWAITHEMPPALPWEVEE